MKRSLVTLVVLMGACSELTAAQITATRIRVGQNAMASHVTKKVAPAYPPEARQAHVQGSVTLKVQINRAGDVTDVKLISGHPMLAPAAIEAVKQWRYKPLLLNGEAIAVETEVTVNFTLGDDTQTGAPAGIVHGKGGVYSGVIPIDPGHAVRPAVPGRARVSQNVMEGFLIHKVQPENPGDAARIQGTVLLSATIDKEGNVGNLRLISGHPMLAPAAIEAVRQWKYRPYLLNGKAVEVETTVTVYFDLLK